MDMTTPVGLAILFNQFPGWFYNLKKCVLTTKKSVLTKDAMTHVAGIAILISQFFCWLFTQKHKRKKLIGVKKLLLIYLVVLKDTMTN